MHRHRPLLRRRLVEASLLALACTHVCSQAPDHLVPVPHWTLAGLPELDWYRAEVWRLFGLDDAGLRAVCLPPFAPESCLSLRRLHNGDYLVTFARASDTLWYRLQERWESDADAEPERMPKRKPAEPAAAPAPKEPEPKETPTPAPTANRAGGDHRESLLHLFEVVSPPNDVGIHTTTKSAPLNAATGDWVSAIWRQTVMQTRHPEVDDFVLHGTTWVFACDMHLGQTDHFSPGSPPHLLSTVYRRLADYALAKPADRVAALEAVHVAARALSGELAARRTKSSAAEPASDK